MEPPVVQFVQHSFSSVFCMKQAFELTLFHLALPPLISSSLQTVILTHHACRGTRQSKTPIPKPFATQQCAAYPAPAWSRAFLPSCVRSTSPQRGTPWALRSPFQTHLYFPFLLNISFSLHPVTSTFCHQKLRLEHSMVCFFSPARVRCFNFSFPDELTVLIMWAHFKSHAHHSRLRHKKGLPISCTLL